MCQVALFINVGVLLIKKAFFTPPMLENGMPNIMMYFSGVNCSFSSGMPPPLGLYMFDLLLTHNRMFVALPCRGPNANCILVGSQQGHPWRPKGAVFCLARVCLCSHVLRLLRTVQLQRCSLHQDHQKNNRVGVTERTENMSHSVVCLKYYLKKTSRLIVLYLYIFFAGFEVRAHVVCQPRATLEYSC